MPVVALRKFTYPYQAALAICNDADAMTGESFRLFHRYLNTDQETLWGRGLKMPIGDSFFLFSSPQSPNKLTFFDGLSDRLSRDAGLLRDCAQAGLIDTLHTYGCFTRPDDFSRNLAQRGLEELERQGIRLRVWVNHGTKANVQCFGPGSSHSQGDVPGTNFYHTDLTLAYGIRYGWMGDELNDCVGQDSQQWVRSTLDQGRIALRCVRRRQINGVRRLTRRLLRQVELRDGQSILSFQRYAGTAGMTPVIDNLPDQLSAKNLRRLKERKGYAVIYQHLAVRRKQAGFGPDSYKPNEPPYLLPPERAAFERLAEAYHDGDILVTTTSKLLRYNTVERGLKWWYETAGDRIRIILFGLEEPGGKSRQLAREEVGGVTFYTPKPEMTEIIIRNGHSRNGHEGELVRELRLNPADATGQRSVTIPDSAVTCPEL